MYILNKNQLSCFDIFFNIDKYISIKFRIKLLLNIYLNFIYIKKISCVYIHIYILFKKKSKVEILFFPF